MSRVSVVTGGNKGVGFGVVRALCSQVGGTVILAARDEGRGKAAVEALVQEGLAPVFEQLDITNEESVERFASRVKETYGGIDILCNNAGIAYKNASTAPLLEKSEVTNATNLLATIKVTRALLPLMRKGGRICQVASMAGQCSWTFPEQDNSIRQRLTDPSLTEAGLLGIYEEYIAAVKADDYSLFKRDSAYSTSKTFLNAHTVVLARELEGSGVILNSCCPGYVDTDMTSHKGHLTIDEGAVTPTYVCTTPTTSGNFYRECRRFDWVAGEYIDASK